MADADTSLAERDPDALEKEIERTRAELARTIDTIAERVNPARVAKRAVTRARSDAAQINPVVAGIGAAVLVAGVAAFVIWRRRR
ncbi:MAG TPA: DUF3618 domain-containing protein [Streptosporangiaceae bacterium]|nr:DUF3618 domain-containing protein [Streptosporangiaceae bacterium]